MTSNAGLDMDDYHRRIAEAIGQWALMYPIPAWRLAEGKSAENLARNWSTVASDAVLAVRDEEIEKLRKDVQAAREEAAYAVEALNGAENRRQMWRERAEKAEAATERVLKTAFAAVANYPDDTRTLIAAADFIASALDIERPLVVADVLRRAQAWLDARSGGDAK